MATTPIIARKPSTEEVTLTVEIDANRKHVVIGLGSTEARLILTPEEAIAFAAMVYTQGKRIATKPPTVNL